MFILPDYTNSLKTLPVINSKLSKPITTEYQGRHTYEQLIQFGSSGEVYEQEKKEEIHCICVQ